MKPIIEADESITSALEFVLSYNIPPYWGVYEGRGKKFVAYPGPYSHKYDSEDWLYLGEASNLIQTQWKGIWKRW